MTPKEKANELSVKMLNAISSNPTTEQLFREEPIKCALICVDEIISACEYNHVESWNTDWWSKVKQELENL